MTAQKGRDVLLKLNTTGSTYVTIGGAKTVTWTISNTPVDITNADDAGVRKLLENAGVNSISIKCQGVYMDSANDALVNADAMSNVHRLWQLVWPGVTSDGTLAGSFMIASLEKTGAFNEGATYNITLESAGACSFTPS
ncbi:phage major tail protein, TP901-1 family [Frankia sp. RB7]|nr:phage major tail protein, TP901-1 family [Frankia sp. RB7]